MKRVGDWMQTFSGRAFYPLDPRASEVDIHDIAHALAHQCRYAGHCRTHYSVAEHSVRVAEVLEPLGPDMQLAGLLHDAAEAYLVDLPRPVKTFMPDYKVAELRVEAAVWEAFGIEIDPAHPAIKTADEILLATEARDLMAKPPRSWNLKEAPMVAKIVPLSAESAKNWFLSRFNMLHRNGAAFA